MYYIVECYLSGCSLCIFTAHRSSLGISEFYKVDLSHLRPL